MKKAHVQYTIRNVPSPVDSVLRDKAKRQGKSLNDVALEALRAGAGVSSQVRYSDLDDFFGCWISDKAVHKALEEQRRVDERLWK